MSQISVVFADDGTTSDGLRYQISGTLTFSTTATSGSLVFNDTGKSSGIKYNMGGLFRFDVGPVAGTAPSWSLPSSFSFTNGISSSASFATYLSGTPPITVTGGGFHVHVTVDSTNQRIVYDGVNSVSTSANCSLLAVNSVGSTVSSAFSVRIALGNHPPGWNTTLISVPQGGSFDLHNRCSDQDVGDSLTFAPLSGYTGGISLDAGTGIFNVSTTVSSGAYAINTRATDLTGLSSDSGNITLSVTGTTQSFNLQRGASVISSFAGTQTGWNLMMTAAQAGDIVLVTPGTYNNVTSAITKAVSVRCNPVPPLGSPASSFATFDQINDSISQPQPYAFDIQGLRVYGRKVYGLGPTDIGNFGIALNGLGNTCSTIGCLIEECGQGAIIGGNFRYAYFVDTTFNDCGCERGTANTHMIYMGIANPVVFSDTTLSVIGCLFQHTYDWRTISSALQTSPNLGNWRFNEGHVIKSDAARTIVKGNKIIRGGSTTQHPSLGTDTATVQLDYGGYLYVAGNIIEEGPKSAYQPDSNPNGIQPSGQYARTSTGGPGFDTRIMDAAVQAHNSSAAQYGAPWPTQSTIIAQNTIINNGVSSERLFTRSFTDAYTNSTSPFFGQSPPAPLIIDNVIVTGLGLADSGGTTWTATTNTVVSSAASICIDPTNENWALVSTVAGSSTWADVEFVSPVGHKARTDSNRGAYSPGGQAGQKPLWWRNPRNRGTQLNVGEWYRFDSSTLDAVSWNTANGSTVVANTPYPFNLNGAGGNSPIYSLDRDTTALVNIAASHTDYIAEAEHAMGAGGQGNFGFRQSGSWIIWQAGGHRSTISNGTHAFQANTDYPKYQQFDTCSDYKAAVGPRLNNTTSVPATYTGTTMTAGDLTTGYLWLNPSTGAAPNQFWCYYYDQRPIIGHLGWNLQYDDVKDRLLRVGGGTAYITAGSSQLDVMDWSTKQWRSPNTTASLINPAMWFSRMGQSTTTGTNSDNTVPAPQGTSYWGAGKAIDRRNGTLYTVATDDKWVVMPLDANDTYNTGRIKITPIGGFKTPISGGVASEPICVAPARNMVYYMDYYSPRLAGSGNHQRYTLQRLDISTNPPTALAPLDVTGALVGWLYPPLSSGTGALGSYQTFNGLVYEPVLDKLLYFDNFFSDMRLDANGVIIPFLNGSNQPSEEDGSHVHIYQIDPSTGVSEAMDTLIVSGQSIAVTGQTDPFTGRPTFPPPGNTLGGTATTNNAVYSEELEGVLYVSGCTRRNQLSSNTWNLSGGHSIYFIRTH